MLKKINPLYILLVILFLFIFRVVFSTVPLAANDFPYLSQGELSARFSLPYAWWERGSQGFGEYTIPFLWVYPVDLLYGFTSFMGLNFAFIERVFGIIPAIVLAAWGIQRLLKRYKLSDPAIIVGILIYTLNTYFLLLIDGGQLAFALSYALLPFTFMAFLDALEDKTMYSKIRAALLLFALGILDLRYVYITSLLLALYLIYTFVFVKRSEYISYLRNWISLGILSGLLLVGGLAYMLVPALFGSGIALPEGYARVSQTNFLSFATLGNAVLLLQPHWYKNVFGNLTILRFEFLIFPLLAFVAPLLHKKEKVIGFWLLLSLIGIFLTKGALEPLPQIYPWLFTNIPGFSLFRDSTKFYVFITLSYSVLSSYTIHAFLKRGVSKYVITPVILCFFLLVTSPIWTNEMTGMLSVPRYLTEFKNVESVLSTDSSFGRILWIPGRTPLSYADSDKPAVEASRLISLRPFAIGIVGNYELFNFLRDAPFMDQILSISGITYIGYPYPDEKRYELKEDEKKYYQTFLGQLSNSEWSDGRITDEPIPLIKTKSSQDHIFLAPNHYFVVGSDRLYWDLSKIPSFDLSKNVLTFAEERKTQIPSDASIILYKKQKIDVAMTQVSDEHFIFPASNIPFEPKENGWWKREGSDLISWRAFLQEKYAIDNLDFDYGGGWAIAEGKRELVISDERIKKGKLLFARVMTSTKGGSVEFWQSDVKIGEITTKDDNNDAINLTTRGWNEVPDQTYTYEDTHVSWYEGFQILNDGPITIKTSGDINVINTIAVLNEDEWRTANNQITSLHIYVWDVIPEIEKEHLFTATAPGSLSYERISPVHYKLRVEGITKPQTLVFSETYDSLWELNRQKSFSSYSMLNGFSVTQNGEYDLYFSAQKYVQYGLILTILTLGSVLFLLLALKRGTMKK